VITRFWGENVGILRRFSVDLRPLTFLVGPNASGKSTFLRGLRCLAMLMRNPIYGPRGALALGYRATLEDLFSAGFRDDQLVLGVEVVSALGSGTYEISMRILGGLVTVVDERIRWDTKRGAGFTYPSGQEFNYIHRGNALSSKLPRATSLPYFCGEIQRREPAQRQVLQPLYDLVSCFSPFHVYRFSPSSVARPVSPAAELAYDGGGLAAELDRLLGMKRPTFDSIVARLQASFGHIDQLKVDTLTGEKGPLKGLKFQRKDGTVVDAEMESDGVLLTLAHLILSTRADPAIGVEEPETATYPSLIESRLRLFRELAEGGKDRLSTQILVTTHSHLLLSALQDPEQVRIFEPGADNVRIYQPPEATMFEVIGRRLGWSVGTE